MMTPKQVVTKIHRHIIRTIQRHCPRNLPPTLYFLKIIQGHSLANGEADLTHKNMSHYIIKGYW